MPTVVTQPDQRLVQRRVCLCPIPTDLLSNASYALGYTGANLTQIDKTVDGTTYRKTLTFSGSQLTAVSAWVAL